MARWTCDRSSSSRRAPRCCWAPGRRPEAGRPYPGFFATPTTTSYPSSRRRARRSASGDGSSRWRAIPAHPERPRGGRAAIRYEVERAARPGSPWAEAAALDVEPAGGPLRGLLSRLGAPAGRRRRGVRAEPRRGAQPPLPPLYVPLGCLQRGGARGGTGRAPVRGGPGRTAGPAALDPRVGLLPHVSGQCRPRALA